MDRYIADLIGISKKNCILDHFRSVSCSLFGFSHRELQEGCLFFSILVENRGILQRGERLI